MTLLIPSIDLIEGQVVRLRHGSFRQKTVYDGSPLDVAQRFADLGARKLHVVDLDGARKSAVIHWDLVAELARLPLELQLGGGVQSASDVTRAFDCGVTRVVVGSSAVRHRACVLEWLEEHGPDRIVIAADARNDQIAIDAWREASSFGVVDFIRDYAGAGALRFLCTDVGRDGDLSGPALDLYARLKEAIPTAQLIASGGIRSPEDLRRLDAVGVEEAVVGRALHEGGFSPETLRELSC
jgi:phosphoribosylformimino-5-aminoimidazole carboxamide ribotide isomerase